MAKTKVAKGDALADYLRSQRWFGDKTATIRGTEVVDRIPIKWPNSAKAFAVARVRVATNAGASTYQLFAVDEQEQRDALQDADFTRGLVDAFASGAAFGNDVSRWIVESETSRPLVVPPSARIALASAEQTNSSVIVDGEAILKLYRRLERGIHPDVEVTRFLTIAREFVHTPVLLGTIRFEDGEGTTIAGMLQELVPGATDGWSHALESSKEYFKGKTRAEPSPVLPFEEEAHELGRVTRVMHETLASGEPGSAFERHNAGRNETRGWADKARRMMERAMASLARAVAQEQLGDEDMKYARTVVDRRPEYLAWLDALVVGIGQDAGSVTRTHGDYHLGQVLRSAADKFLVIDFEGEPARPLDDRRAHQSPLRDVAGMLRSFAYAAAVGGGTEPAGVRRAERWEQTMRDAFLRGYLSGTKNDVTLLPASRPNAERLLALFEAEKIFYELQYELDHRPDWVWIPLRGIARLA